MPSLDAHLATARNNYDLLAYLRANRLATDAGWVAVVAFYTALHVVEAVFAKLHHGGIEPTTTHYERRNVLRNVRQYSKLWQHYRPRCTTPRPTLGTWRPGKSSPSPRSRSNPFSSITT